MPEKKTATAATTNRLWNLGKVLKSIFKVKNIKKQNLCHETEQNITLPTFDNLDLHIQQVDRNKLNIFPKLLGERKIRFHFSFNLCFIFIFLIFVYFFFFFHFFMNSFLFFLFFSFFSFVSLFCLLLLFYDRVNFFYKHIVFEFSLIMLRKQLISSLLCVLAKQNI